MSVIEDAAAEALSAALDPALRDDAKREAHKLAGSLGTFGIPRGTELSRRIEAWMQPDGPRDAAAILELSDAVVELRACLDAGPASKATSAAPQRTAIRSDGPFILLVDDDPVLADGLRLEAGRRDLRLEIARDTHQGLQLARRGPEAVLVGAADAGMENPFALMKELRAQFPSVPVIVLTGADVFTDRVEAVRLGAKRFLRKPANPATVLEAVDEVVKSTRFNADTVLAVDDDPSALAALAALLESQGKRVVAVRDALEFWDTLERTLPDLVMLDVGMPEVNGVELCQVLRADPRWSHLPVMFLTADTDPRTVGLIFDAGGDDYLSKPLVGPELLARVSNRLERTKLLRRMVETDPITGTANQRTSAAQIEGFLASGKRFGEPVSIADVDVDGLRSLNDRAGYTAGDEVLRWLGELLTRSFDAHDVVGRWAGQEFVIGMSGMSRADGVERLAAVLEEFRQHRFVDGNGEEFSMSFSGGVAQHPQDGEDLQVLQKAARSAVRAAKGAGGDRVVPAGWSVQDEAVVDVVVVEDDEALAGILQYGLATRAYRTLRFDDGEDAVQALQGPNPQIFARIVLLDWGLPSLDGLGVLRRLADTGVLSRTRVIMLTARDSETEVLQALDMGAYDHVSKPFSVPVLMKRIHRAMERRG